MTQIKTKNINLEKSGNNKSKYSIFGQKTLKVGTFSGPYCVTGTVTLVLEHHLVLECIIH